ncbi:hypothetical protein BZA70DRAFT_275085 [Myxozyma melibiosi]|uniref:F-box domain-containing protein n=1 Tax=Myxozyma melibiosi TaxID=54550 RepID=A0ABR1FAD7_9ASCO
MSRLEDIGRTVGRLLPPLAFVALYSFLGYLALPITALAFIVVGRFQKSAVLKSYRKPQPSPSSSPSLSIRSTSTMTEPAYTGPPQLTRLPPEIFIQVAEYLSIRDIFALELTCRHLHAVVADQDLWRAKILADFKSRGLVYADELRARNAAASPPAVVYPFRAIYAAMAIQWRFFCAAPGWGLIWREPRYWQVMPSPESAFGSTLNLKSVFWLHLFRSMRVAPGRYRAVWGMRLQRSLGLATVDFSIKVDDDERAPDDKGRPERVLAQQVQLGDEIVKALTLDGGWCEVELPVFEIPSSRVPELRAGWRTILVEVKETGGHIKAGLWLDYFRLERLDDNNFVDGREGGSEQRIYITPYAERSASSVYRLSENSAVSVDSDEQIRAAFNRSTDADAAAEQRWTIADVVRDLKEVINTFPESSGLVY